ALATKIIFLSCVFVHRLGAEGIHAHSAYRIFLQRVRSGAHRCPRKFTWYAGPSGPAIPHTWHRRGPGSRCVWLRKRNTLNDCASERGPPSAAPVVPTISAPEYRRSNDLRG